MTRDTFLAAARHGVSLLAGMGIILGLMKAGDSEKLMQGLTDITQGVGEVMVVLGPLLGGLMAWLAARSSTIAWALKTVSAIPETTVVTEPKLANSTPDENVLPNDEHTVVANDQIVGVSVN